MLHTFGHLPIFWTLSALPHITILISKVVSRSVSIITNSFHPFMETVIILCNCASNFQWVASAILLIRRQTARFIILGSPSSTLDHFRVPKGVKVTLTNERCSTSKYSGEELSAQPQGAYFTLNELGTGCFAFPSLRTFFHIPFRLYLPNCAQPPSTFLL